jgi:hypothetical protein
MSVARRIFKTVEAKLIAVMAGDLVPVVNGVTFAQHVAKTAPTEVTMLTVTTSCAER